jgi:hypothetical protein
VSQSAPATDAPDGAGFAGTDPLYLTAMEAHSILEHLCAQVRYRSADRRKKE